MNKKVISFSVYINLGELQNCPAFLMHKQALEKRWHLGGMEAQASNSALCDHYVFHVAGACLCCIRKAGQFVPLPTPNRKEEKKMVKLTPPMGWNSWNTFGEKINESLIKETADCMAASGLKDAGYDYLVIDDCWSLKERDAQGRLVADPAKFPNGMKAVADYVHSKGLKFGMYSCAGNLTCAGYPGSYEHEFTDAETFASWGVDFLKYDYCYHSPIVAGKYLYRRMGLALENCGRDILFSACSWGADETHEWMKESGASMWRSTGDIFDTWNSRQGSGSSTGKASALQCYRLFQ